METTHKQEIIDNKNGTITINDIMTMVTSRTVNKTDELKKLENQKQKLIADLDTKISQVK